jgi:hypothetical protein
MRLKKQENNEEHKMDFNEWMKFGIENGWCGPPVCYTHDGLPLSIEEETLLYEEDPCIHVVRMYESPEMAKEILDNHSPSNWRDHYSL